MSMITKPATAALHHLRQATTATPNPAAGRTMPWFPAVPPALAAADGGRTTMIGSKKRAGLPKLLHKLFVKVLRLRPATAAEEEFYGYRMHGGGGEEYCYYYSYGGAGSSWAGVLSSIPEEDDSSEEGTPDVVAAAVGPAVLRKSQSERFVVGPPPDAAAAAVVHVEVLL